MITPPKKSKNKTIYYDMSSKVQRLLGSYGDLVSEVLGLGHEIDQSIEVIKALPHQANQELLDALIADAKHMFERIKKYADLLAKEKITRVQYLDQLEHVKKELNFVMVQLKDLSGEKVIYLSKGRK